MPIDRRTLLVTGAAASTGFAAAAHAGAGARVDARIDTPQGVRAEAAAYLVLAAREGEDQTDELQAAIGQAAQRGLPLMLAPGTFRVGTLTLRPNTHIVGASQQAVLEFTGGGAFLVAEGAPGIRLEGFTIDGNGLALDARRGTGLLSLDGCTGLSLSKLIVRRGLLNGIALTQVSGRVTDCMIAGLSQAGLISVDAQGLDVSHNTVSDCANNGIQIWRTSAGHDGTIVTQNRIERIAAKGGGSGQNGNGVNVFRAGGVLVSANHIADCAYSAIRGNAASDIQMIGNSCRKIGEVALYAEFAFEGALIQGNVVETAASGIAVTNFNEGGRLAVVQGNLVRNLFRREHEPVDKRGDGISVEADATVTGNVVEGAPTAGIIAGWGRYLRDVAITGNVVRSSGVGILVSSDASAGACLVSQNMISGSRNGAIRAMDGDGAPVGPDLVAADAPKVGRVMVSGNVAA